MPFLPETLTEDQPVKELCSYEIEYLPSAVDAIGQPPAHRHFQQF